MIRVLDNGSALIRLPRIFQIAAVLSALLLTIGHADDSSSTFVKDQRIVCFSPAITQMIVDLGAAERIVGVGAFDPVAPPHAEVVGHLYRIDYEKLLLLNPTDIVMQITRQGVPERLRDLAARHGWELHRFELNTRADALHALYHQNDGTEDHGSVGQLLHMPQAARLLKEKVSEQLAGLAELTADLPHPRVLMVIGQNPLTAVGPGTFLNEMLLAAGGRNVLEDADGQYPVLDRERLLLLAPEVIVLVQPRPGGSEAAEEDAVGGERRMNLPDSLDARVVVVDDITALLPSTTMGRVAAQFARRLHPGHPQLMEQIRALFADDKQP